MLKAAPSAGLPSAVITPLWFCTIFLQIASPIPVPSYSLLPWRRWKSSNICSAYFCSKPMPLSAMTILQYSSCRGAAPSGSSSALTISAFIFMTGGTPGWWYLIALIKILVKSWFIWRGATYKMGSCVDFITAWASSMQLKFQFLYRHSGNTYINVILSHWHRS